MNFVFNIAKGAAVEKVRDGSSAIGVLLLKAAESDAVMRDRATIAGVLSGSTEADFTNYARITGITATLNVDNAGDVATLAISDQVWTLAGGATNNSLVKLIIFYDEGGTDATRIPLTAYDFSLTTTGADLTAYASSVGFYKAK